MELRSRAIRFFYRCYLWLRAELYFDFYVFLLVLLLRARRGEIEIDEEAIDDS